MDISLEQILTEENIQEAIAKVESRKGVGEDGILPSKLREYWELNGEKILDAIRRGEYTPGKVIQYEQLNKRRKKRRITVFNAVDQMIARAISQALTPVIDGQLSDSCYAYRPGRSAKLVAEHMAKQIEEGKTWVVEVDVTDFFDSMNHYQLFDAINRMIKDDRIVQLISSFVNCVVITDEGEIRLARGVLQGMPLSPLLSNIYLTHMDEICSIKYEGYFRYGDDIRVTSYKKEDADTILADIKEIILENDLKYNEKKTGVFQSLSRYCLGYEFQEKRGQVFVTPVVHNRNTSNYMWQTTSLKKTSDHYHIVSDGILTKKDYTLLFENEEEKKYLPIEDIDSLSIYSNVIFSSNFFELANSERLMVNIVNSRGEFAGRFLPQKCKRDIHTELMQLSVLNDNKQRIALARSFQKANLFNVRAALRYYKRRAGNQKITQAVEEITSLMNKLGKANDIGTIMAYEAQARQKYYQCFNEIMPGEDFRFVKRTKRPPRDALNAMISFGNTLLYTRFAAEIYHSQLDIRIGILHSSFKRPENLNLDLADLFKPILVDRTIFTLVNRNMIDEMTDFEEVESGGIYLSSRGKRIFITEFEKKLEQSVEEGETKVTYEELIRKEVRKLQDFYKNGTAYKPYKYVN